MESVEQIYRQNFGTLHMIAKFTLTLHVFGAKKL